MTLPDLRNFDLADKGVLLRVDLDVPFCEIKHPDDSTEMKVVDETRLESLIPTTKLLLDKKAKYVCLLGHIGRYQGGEGQGISTHELNPVISKLLGESVSSLGDGYASDDWPPEKEWISSLPTRVHLLENLRLYPGEEQNDESFAKAVASAGDFYVNDAFAVSHRAHASIVGLPKLLPHAAGLHLMKEVENLSRVLENLRKPVVVILGGAKVDKLEAIPGLLKFADYILVGGRLPLEISNIKYQISNSGRVIIGALNEDGKDITLETIEKFGEILRRAGTIIWSGPLGQYEVDGGAGGTKQVAEMVVDSGAFKVIGGGDTEAALTRFDLVSKIDFVSSGGGAMLEFLARGDLPGLAALRERFV